jgi:PEGA domain
MMSSILPSVRSAVGALLTLWALSTLSAMAHAEPGAAVVLGGAPLHQRGVVRTAVEQALREAGWSLQPMPSQQTVQIAACFAAEQPWTCLVPMAASRGIARVMLIQVERESGGRRGQVRITGQLSGLDRERVALDFRYCSGCNDGELASTARALSQRLLVGGAVRNATSRIEVRTTPPGAIISLDGRMVDAPDNSIIASPGVHTLHLQLSGYRSEVRSVVVEEGQSALVEIAFARHGVPSTPTSRPADLTIAAIPAARQGSRPALLGRALAIGGAAMVVAGGVLITLDEDAERDPDRRHHKTYFDSAVTGTSTVIAGAGCLAIGLYYLKISQPPENQTAPTNNPPATPSRHSVSPRREGTPAAMVVPGGAVVAWMGVF